MYAAVIVETREVKGFGQIVRNHLKYLPENWKLVVYCSKGNREFVESEMEGLTYNLAGEVTINKADDYNKLLLSVGFWEQLLPYERVLIFQSDSELLRTGVEEFLEWDYVGAPWPFKMRGGNGGLSIRNPQAMIDCIKEHADKRPGIGLLLLLTCMMFRKKFFKNA